MSRRPVWITLALGAVLAAAAGVAINRVAGSVRTQLGWFTLATILLIIAAIVARWNRQGRQEFRLQVIDPNGRLPRLGEVTLSELGVHWSQISNDDESAYIRRDVDGALDEAISSGQRLIAICGAALAGRTRTLAQAARRHAADSWLVRFVAMPGASLADMIAAARRLAHGGPAVLWLENPDLGLLLQLSADLLDQLPWNLRIFMTVDTRVLDPAVLPRDVVDVLSAPSGCIQLGLITESERGRLAANPAYEAIIAAHNDEPVLMGRLMVSLDRVANALQVLDEDAVCRVAVLHAAVDWQRAGVPKPLTSKLIEKLYHDGYWDQIADRKQGSETSKSQFERALKSLLTPSRNHGPQLLDEIYAGRATYLRAHRLLTVVADNPQQPPGWAVSETLWTYLAKTLNHSDRLTVGRVAYARADYLPAGRMLEVVDPRLIPAGVILQIGMTVNSANNIVSARRWYLKAAESNNATVAAAAMLELGILEKGADRIDDARGWFLKAVESSNATVAARAMLELGVLEQEADRIDDARGWYVKALGTHHQDVAPRAMHLLGDLERKVGRVSSARRWYLKAIDSGHSNSGSSAMFHLGQVEAKAHRISKARTWFTKAAEGDDSDVAPRAMYQLGELERQLGRNEEASRWYLKAAESDHSKVMYQAKHRLAHLEWNMGHIVIAQNYFEEAAKSDDNELAATCMNDLGNLARKIGYIREARRWYRRAIDSGHKYVGPGSMISLGDLEVDQGQPQHARRWYQKAIDSGEGDIPAKAMYGLGRLEQHLGHLKEARGWYVKSSDAGNEDAKEALAKLQKSQDVIQRVDNFMKYGHSYIAADHNYNPLPPITSSSSRKAKRELCHYLVIDSENHPGGPGSECPGRLVYAAQSTDQMLTVPRGSPTAALGRVGQQREVQDS